MKKLFTLILGAIILAAGLGYFFYHQNVNYVLDPGSTDPITVDIPENSTAATIGNLLEEEGLIKSMSFFQFYVEHKEVDQKLQSGRFVFRENYTLDQIVDTLANEKGAEISVTLLEGWTARQIAEKLEEQGLTTAESFMECIENCNFEWDILPGDYVEGYLYPDTYFVNPLNYNDEAFIDRLISTLDSKLTEEDRRGIKNSPYSFEEIMIMASIVEREERVESERPTVAGILWNRFDEGAGLGADATVLYGLGRTSGGLTYQDLQDDSPYNTRKYAGLPPTPISNPSLSSIRAAIFPEETDYWYYLHDDAGQVHYAKTLEGHNENKARYIR